MFFKKPTNKWVLAFDYLLAAGIIFWTFFLFTNSPEQIVESMNMSQGYLLMLIVAFMGGLAMVTFVSVYPTVISFAIGGLNPIIVGIAAAIGMTLANSVYFYLGYKGQYVASKKSSFHKYTNKILNWLNKKPRWLIPIVIWAYVGLTPFSNNFLTVSGGVLNYSFKKPSPLFFWAT